ncbi:MAG: SpoIIE family protein phosphatase, partial [Candidatus Kapabacteria bacterium]|nr:SpoIIE family protein phosphatase [Candidatus Kapabacteria bacterium]
QCAWEIVYSKGVRVDSLAVIEEIVPGGVTDAAGLKNGDTLVMLDGRQFSYKTAQRIIDKAKNGESVQYGVQRNGRYIETYVRITKTFSTYGFALLLTAFGFILVGMVVVVYARRNDIAERFIWYCLSCGFVFCFSVAGSWWNQYVPVWSRLVIYGMLTLCYSFSLVNQLWFYLHFPVKKKVTANPWVFRVLLSITAALTIAEYFVLSTNGVFSSIFYSVVQFLLGSFYMIGLVQFLITFVGDLNAEQRKPFYAVGISFIGAFIVLIYVYVISVSLPYLQFVNPELLLPVIMFVLPPFMLGYAIFRYGLMDTSIIVERSIIFAVATTVLALVYFVMVWFLSEFVRGFITGLFDIPAGKENFLITLIPFVMLALIFDPVKRKVEQWVERIFYQERVNYQKALLDLSRELPGLINFDHIVKTLSTQLASTMHLKKVAILLNEERYSGFEQPAKAKENGIPPLGDERGTLFDELKRQQAPVYIERHETAQNKTETDENLLAAQGIVLAVPMLVKDELIGVIAVGKKESGKAFSKDDLDLLLTIASQSAIAFENARLHDSEVQKQKLDDSLALARRIQQGLLPTASVTVEGLDVAGVSIPAEVVGGDFYDLIKISPDRLLVVVGDVSGKGISAALYMSKIQGMLQLAAHSFDSPKEMLIHVNRHIFDGLERNAFVTMALALFDTSAGTVNVVRAGHTKPLLANGSNVEFLQSKGLGVGLSKGDLFGKCLEEITLPLSQGMTYVLYSDGLNEAVNEQREQFGTDVMCNVVSVFKQFPAKTVQQNLVKSVNDFRGAADLFDDLTVVVVKT